MGHGQSGTPSCVPITAACPSPQAPFGSAGMPAHKLGCSTKPRHEQPLACSQMGKPKPRSSEGNLPSGTAPLPGRAPRPRHVEPWGHPVAGVLTSFCSREGLPVALAGRIAGCFAGEGFASFQTLRRPPYLRPEICERVRAYVCVRLELSGIFHAGHAFPCLQPFPTSPQAGGQAGRPACIGTVLPAARPPLPPLPPRGCPCAPAKPAPFSQVFVFPNLQSFVCECVRVCAHAHCGFFLSLSVFFLPFPTACFARWLKFASQ